jgi:hypothetical protein
MSGRVSPPRWTNHPAVRLFGSVLVVRDMVLTVLALGALVAGGLARHDTLSVVALGLGALALAGVVASSVVGQRRAGDLDTGHDGGAQLHFDESPTRVPAPEAHVEPQEPQPAHVAVRSAVADQVSGGRKLKAEMVDTQEKGAWDDDGWVYRRQVEAWTARTVVVLQECGQEDLARALPEVQPAPRPPFEALLKGHSPAYARLVGLLDGRIALLEESQA